MHRSTRPVACALFLSVLLAALLIAGGCSGNQDAPASDTAAPDNTPDASTGTATPSTTTSTTTVAAAAAYPSLDLDGYKALIQESAGKVLLVCIWSVDCPACQQELPVLEQVTDKHDPEKLRVVYASLDRSDQAVASFFGDYKPIAEVVRVNDHVAAFTGTEYIPRLVIYDAKGQVSFIDSGFYPEAMLEALLNRAGLAE